MLELVSIILSHYIWDYLVILQFIPYKNTFLVSQSSPVCVVQKIQNAATLFIDFPNC